MVSTGDALVSGCWALFSNFQGMLSWILHETVALSKKFYSECQEQSGAAKFFLSSYDMRRYGWDHNAISTSHECYSGFTPVELPRSR